jgi:anthranilate phosphoribosyltransferase
MLEELGLELPLGPVDASRCLEATGFTFLFAPEYHPAMRAVAEVRKTLGVRTVFNILGPLVNPCEPEYNVIGAYSKDVARLMAHAISGLRIKRTFVIHGEPGWDEATPCGPFTVFDVTPGAVREETRDPADYGFEPCKPEDLAGGDAAENAAALKRVFEGERGAHRDALVLGAALVEEVTGRADAPEACRAAAESAIDDGRARGVLEGLARFSKEDSRAS